MLTLRQKIIDAVIARMQTISIANHYETDIGARVDDWPRYYQESELKESPRVGVYDLQEIEEKDSISAGEVKRLLTVQIRCFISRDTSAQYLRQALGDIATAISTDLTWGELVTTTWPKQNGYVIPKEAFEISGAAVEIDIEYYTGTFNPYSV